MNLGCSLCPAKRKVTGESQHAPRPSSARRRTLRATTSRRSPTLYRATRKRLQMDLRCPDAERLDGNTQPSCLASHLFRRISKTRPLIGTSRRPSAVLLSGTKITRTACSVPPPQLASARTQQSAFIALSTSGSDAKARQRPRLKESRDTSLKRFASDLTRAIQSRVDVVSLLLLPECVIQSWGSNSLPPRSVAVAIQSWRPRNPDLHGILR